MTLRNYARYRVVVPLATLACFFGIAQLGAEDKRKHTIDPATTAINAVKIATTERDILKLLGKPKSVEGSYSHVESKPSKYFYYDGMKIYLIDGYIYGLSCTGSKCKTDRGVKIGDSKARVVEIYGPGNLPYSGATSDSLSYPLKGIDSYLIFIFKEDELVEIKFFVDYT